MRTHHIDALITTTFEFFAATNIDIFINALFNVLDSVTAFYIVPDDAFEILEDNAIDIFGIATFEVLYAAANEVQSY